MTIHKLTKDFSNSGSRNDVRKRVIDTLINEEPGTSDEENKSQYIYYVEKLSSGDRIYLRRPTKYSGFDFIICVEKANFASSEEETKNAPSYENIKNDLEKKQKADKDMYNKLHALLKRVYECEDIDDSELEAIKFDVGLPVDVVVKTIKWFFISADISGWLSEGRASVWGIIPHPDL